MLVNKTGQSIPKASFKTFKNGKWKTVNSEELFNNKTVIVFSLPGAFTPTCSNSHVPRFNELAPQFKNLGVDEIVCLSVNDTFVMNAWAAEQNADQITFLPDGNGEFTEAMGMLVDKSAIGFGKRSWRYAMIVKNGKIKQMFIEPEKEGDPYEVSDADTVMKYIDPKASKPIPVSIFTKAGCPFCAKAKKMLTDHGYVYEEISLGEGITMATVNAVTNAKTVPQIFIAGKYIGGSDDLERYLTK